jgi:hypothetical protein
MWGKAAKSEGGKLEKDIPGLDGGIVEDSGGKDSCMAVSRQYMETEPAKVKVAGTFHVPST